MLADVGVGANGAGMSSLRALIDRSGARCDLRVVYIPNYFGSEERSPRRLKFKGESVASFSFQIYLLPKAESTQTSFYGSEHTASGCTRRLMLKRKREKKIFWVTGCKMQKWKVRNQITAETFSLLLWG